MIITCYRVRSGFRNVIDGIVLSKPSTDVDYTEIRLVLPAGYQLAESVCGVPTIYDDKGQSCELCLNNLRGTAILAVSASRAIGLKKAPKDADLIPLREARLAAGLTQKQLSDASGVNVRQIQRVEIGEAEAGNLTARNLLAIADVLDVNPRSLLK